MAYTTPITWVDGHRYVAADLNAQVSGNISTLRAGGIAIASQTANDFIIATSSTQFGRLAAVEGESPIFSGGQWTMSSPIAAMNASSIIAAESFA